MPLRWHIDEIGPARLAGWVDKDGPVDAINLVINGETIFTVSPTMYRRDLEEAGVGDGKRSFVLEILDHLTSGINDVSLQYVGQILYRRNVINGPVLATPLPDADLVLSITGHQDSEDFAESRWRCVAGLIEMLAEAGVDSRDFSSILDFGCGCGRILAGWEGLLKSKTELHGCDINEQAVRFCQENITHACVLRSNYLPPLPYTDRKFDFIYAISVYTHLTLPAMLSSTGEIARIIKPDGIVLLTIHGSSYQHTLEYHSRMGSRILADRGYYVYLHGNPEDTWLGSNNYATFATPDFIERIFAGFDLVAAFPGTSHPTDFAGITTH
jgi:SAM-dependent methyltransferase